MTISYSTEISFFYLFGNENIMKSIYIWTVRVLVNCWIYLVTAKLCAIIAILKGIISYKSSRCEVIGPKPSNPVSRGFPSKVVGMISPQVCRFPHRQGKCDVKQTKKAYL